MKAIKQWSIAAVAVMALSVNEFGCGAPDGGDGYPAVTPTDTESDIGSTEQASVEPGVPLGYGWVGTLSCQNLAGQQCEIPRAKHVQTLGNPQLTGHCAGTIWANSFATARSRMNTDMVGTGFTTSDAAEPGNLITARCVSTLPGGAMFKLTPTLQVCSGGPTVFCRMQHATLDVAGDTIINSCVANHTDCNTLERNAWYLGLMQAAGLIRQPPVPPQGGDAHISAAQKTLLTNFVP